MGPRPHSSSVCVVHDSMITAQHLRFLPVTAGLRVLTELHRTACARLGLLGSENTVVCALLVSIRHTQCLSFILLYEMQMTAQSQRWFEQSKENFGCNVNLEISCVDTHG